MIIAAPGRFVVGNGLVRGSVTRAQKATQFDLVAATVPVR